MSNEKIVKTEVTEVEATNTEVEYPVIVKKSGVKKFFSKIGEAGGHMVSAGKCISEAIPAPVKIALGAAAGMAVLAVGKIIVTGLVSDEGEQFGEDENTENEYEWGSEELSNAQQTEMFGDVVDTDVEDVVE